MSRRKSKNKRKFVRVSPSPSTVPSHAQQVKTNIDLVFAKGDIDITRERATEIQYLCCSFDPIGQIICGNFKVDHNDIKLLSLVDKRFPRIIGVELDNWRVNAYDGLLIPFYGGEINLPPEQLVELWLDHIAYDQVKYHVKVQDYYWAEVRKQTSALYYTGRSILDNLKWFFSKERKLLNKLSDELQPEEVKHLPTIVTKHIKGNRIITDREIKTMVTGMTFIGFLKNEEDAASYASSLKAALGLHK